MVQTRKKKNLWNPWPHRLSRIWYYWQAEEAVAKIAKLDQELRDLCKSSKTHETVVVSPARRLLNDIIEMYALHLESICPDDSGLFFSKIFIVS